MEKIQRVLVLEAGIAKTDASLVEGDEITLLNLPFDSLIESDELWKLAMMSQGMNGLDFQELSQMQGVEAEAKPSFSVELK